jgi:type II secretory pathway pseudopilin PulG
MDTTREDAIRELVADIRAGLGDDQLKQKYGLSQEALETLLGQLAQAGWITAAELDQRKATAGVKIDLDLGPGGAAPEASPGLTIKPFDGTYLGSGAAQPRYERPAAPHASQLEAYGRNALIGILGSFALQFVTAIVAAVVAGAAPQAASAVLGLHLLPAIAYFWGFYCLAKRKGYHGALALLGVTGCFGLMIVLLIPDRNKGLASRGYLVALAVLTAFLALMIIGVIIAIAVPYYVAFKRSACDQVASTDVARLGAALQRFKAERDETKSDLKTLPPDVVKYMAGPYYGWAGTNAKCQVLIRVEGDVACGCAMNGSRPKGDERYIFRARLDDGDAGLPAITGPCAGETYGGPEGACYAKGMLTPQGKFSPPEPIKCPAATPTEAK